MPPVCMDIESGPNTHAYVISFSAFFFFFFFFFLFFCFLESHMQQMEVPQAGGRIGVAAASLGYSLSNAGSKGFRVIS